MLGEFPGASYDAWKTRSPDDDAVEEYERADRELDDESLEAALARDEVNAGFATWGPYVLEVLENGEIGFVSTIVLPSRVGWEPVF